MTAQGEEAAAAWRVPDYARTWAERDSLRDLLDFPRHLAAAIVAEDNPAPGVILDVGAGPGAVTEVFLEEFPDARGIWTDASDAMLEMARERLAPFGNRVEYHIVDMTALKDAPLPPAVDVITTSRAAHHLDRDGLFAFYASAADRLAPGGWFVNLDHIGPASKDGPAGEAGYDEVWDARLRRVRNRFGVTADGPKHHHNYPLTSFADHFAALDAAGITDAELAWRSFYTCLFMGRKSD
jgi:SAM-dependent methyltransferase